MKILFVWTGVTSYMADCWRTLAARGGIELKVAVVRRVSGSEFAASEVFSGLDWQLLDDATDSAADVFPGWSPDIVFAVGWRGRVVRDVARAYPRVPRICCFDMPWRRSLRCVAARWVLRRFLAGFAGAFVPGSASVRYARWLGFPRIWEGLFAIDLARFRAAPAPGGTPRGFLYLGRAAREKRLEVLTAAWRRYREAGGDWGLDLAGSAGLAEVARAAGEGAAYLGFVGPERVPSLHRGHGALVLASDFDPWPLVALESFASGRAVIASERCTNWPELAPLGGMRLCPVGSVAAVAAAMRDVSRGALTPPPPEALGFWDVSAWAERVVSIAEEVLK